MRGLKSTLALLVVLIGLGAYIYFVTLNQPADGGTGQQKVFAGARHRQDRRDQDEVGIR